MKLATLCLGWLQFSRRKANFGSFKLSARTVSVRDLFLKLHVHCRILSLFPPGKNRRNFQFRSAMRCCCKTISFAFVMMLSLNHGSALLRPSWIVLSVRGGTIFFYLLEGQTNGWLSLRLPGHVCLDLGGNFVADCYCYFMYSLSDSPMVPKGTTFCALTGSNVLECPQWVGWLSLPKFTLQ